MSQPKALIDEELPGTSGLVALMAFFHFGTEQGGGWLVENHPTCMVALKLVDSYGKFSCFVFDIYIFSFKNLPETIKCKMRKLILIRLSQKHS